MTDIERLSLLGARILVKPDPPESHYGRIIIPDSAKKHPGTGVVVAMGPGMLCKDGTRWPMPDVHLGDHVVFSADAKHVRQLVVIDGVEYQKMHDDDVIAVLEA
jgi:co-chaperonin GroES (HSP10)